MSVVPYHYINNVKVEGSVSRPKGLTRRRLSQSVVCRFRHGDDFQNAFGWSVAVRSNNWLLLEKYLMTKGISGKLHKVHYQPPYRISIERSLLPTSHPMHAMKIPLKAPHHSKAGMIKYSWARSSWSPARRRRRCAPVACPMIR